MNEKKRSNKSNLVMGGCLGHEPPREPPHVPPQVSESVAVELPSKVESPPPPKPISTPKTPEHSPHTSRTSYEGALNRVSRSGSAGMDAGRHKSSSIMERLYTVMSPLSPSASDDVEESFDPELCKAIIFFPSSFCMSRLIDTAMMI